jgi:hypothetical protein
MPPAKPPREVKLTVPDARTQREVLELFEQVDRLPQPQDERSALVEREWTRGRPNSPVMKGHLKEHSTALGVRESASAPLSRNSSQKSEVLRQRFATQKPLKTKGMRPSRETLDFRDRWSVGSYVHLPSPNGPS